jgi:HAD superfamily hydrolase (TIGR01509 family)
MYDAVLLDLYDTLVWSGWGTWQRVFAERLGRTPQEVGRAFVQTRPARSVGAYGSAGGDVAAVIRVLGLDPTPELVADLLDLEQREILTDIHLYDDSLPVLRSLRDRGVKTVLVSNCSFNTRPAVDRLGLEDEFDAVILSFELGIMKPDPAIYREALLLAGAVDPGRAVFVDDQPDYCDGAAALGIDTRLILRPEEDIPPETDGHRVISDLTSLL